MRALDLANHKGEDRTKTLVSRTVAPFWKFISEGEYFRSFVMIIQETGSPDVARAFRVSRSCPNRCEQGPSSVLPTNDSSADPW